MPRNKRRVISKRNGLNSTQDIESEDQLEDTPLDSNSNCVSTQQLVIPVGYKLVPDQQLVDKDSEEDSTQDHIRPKIQVFKGMDGKVSIENWIKRFDMLSNYYKWSEPKKIIMLGNYLEDDALDWYIENTDSDNWAEITDKLITRFGVQTVEPIVEFFNLKYDVKTGIKEYFEKKRRFGSSIGNGEANFPPF